jgi:hypothetical protein
LGDKQMMIQFTDGTWVFVKLMGVPAEESLDISNLEAQIPEEQKLELYGGATISGDLSIMNISIEYMANVVEDFGNE